MTDNTGAAAANLAVATAGQLHAELEQMRGHLARARRMEAVGRLAGVMAHEFNNLVGVIIGNLDLLGEQQGLAGDARGLAGEALDAALKAAEVADRLLSLARRKPLQPTMVIPNEIVSRLIAPDEGAEAVPGLSVDLDTAAWPVMADPVRLEECLVGLARRAGAAEPGATVSIRTANRHLDAREAARAHGIPVGDYVLIEIGTARAVMAADAAEGAVDLLAGGGDIEAASVFAFAAESGGHLEVFAEAGVGTTFRLLLPRIDFGEAGESRAPGPEQGGHETVLAVDDNPGQRRLVARQLRELGYRTLEAEDGPTALMILNTEPVDLLFTDVVMPGGMSGYDLARLTLARWPRMKALLTTAFPEARLSGDQLPPSKLRQLAKPYRKAELAQTLREILDA